MPRRSNRLWIGPLKHKELLAEGQVFDDEVATGAEDVA